MYNFLSNMLTALFLGIIYIVSVILSYLFGTRRVKVKKITHTIKAFLIKENQVISPSKQEYKRRIEKALTT